tara:strand:+ start:1463 stop:2107 length:645 start_codon:yes stop_codon:yes gene_type:complete
MTPTEVITEVRRIIQDTKTPYRYSDTVMLGFVNQTLKRMVVLRPDLFAVIGEFPTTANTVLQTCPADSVRLIEIFQVQGGNAVTEVTRQVLDRTSPSWVSEAAGTPVNFMRHVRNPNRFFVSPPPAAGIVLIGEYAQTPPDYIISAEITYPTDAYFPVVVDGTVFLAESVDNEHVNSNRAKLFQDSFTQALGIGLQSRVVTDTEEGGLDPKQVI